jgi:hypothetical protein
MTYKWPVGKRQFSEGNSLRLSFFLLVGVEYRPIDCKRGGFYDRAAPIPSGTHLSIPSFPAGLHRNSYVCRSFSFDWLRHCFARQSSPCGNKH